MRAVVAIPVCNEAERIGACLEALDRQDGAETVGVVLFLNNCTDGTAHEVAAVLPGLRCRVRVVARDFAGAQAGWARREAMQAAAEWLEQDGVPDGAILTTDADSRVPPDWVSRNRAALEAGADAVAGRIALDPDEAARLPAALHARGRLEGRYEALLTELAARIDPVPHDPWPCHWTTSGATLAVRLAAYRAVGGMPAVPVGEDRAFVASLQAHGARVRHDPDITVITSGRLDGRAPGGAADTMKLRCAQPESPCDPRLEALPRALWRYGWRRRLRRLHARGRLDRTILWAPWLDIPRDEARAIAALPAVSRILAAVEAASPRLARAPLRPRELAAQIRRTEALLALLRTGAQVGRQCRRAGLIAGSPAGAARPGALTSLGATMAIRDSSAEGVENA
ncbi:hypothetical protein OPKNFCMD_2983 [Methylobacterium crusticola]|uniref:Glycosyltransferase 2-like domain-containing protein n=1 Tax=Methylobacterium crusticola TaxID=1697972 RepID=A0ABQ4QYV9_9HYPH|nr:glycosyltransferase family A protein [Methylobacterium crusticola]GJD50246.1 hypothetical protein OPKNFCMD_2983 [Methylobacterium crusticola]